MTWGSVADEGGLISGLCGTYMSHQRDKSSLGVLLFKPLFLMAKRDLVLPKQVPCSKDAQAYPRLQVSVHIPIVSTVISRTCGTWIRPWWGGQSEEEDKGQFLSSPWEKGKPCGAGNDIDNQKCGTFWQIL